MDYPPDLAKLPPILFKYRSFDEFGWRALAKLEFFFASPEHFNDPLDTRIPILYERGTFKQMYRMNVERLKWLPIKMTRKERKRLAKEMARTVHRNKNNPNLRDKYRKVVSEQTNKMAGILSLSAVRDHTLMWSHYADSHRGFCIGLNSRKLIQFINRKAREGILLLPGQVRYYDELPKIDPYKMDDAQVFMTKLFSKSKEWSYEKEYRILCSHRPNFALKLDPSILHSVTFGAKCRTEDKRKAVGLIEEKRCAASLEEVRINEAGKFELTTI